MSIALRDVAPRVGLHNVQPAVPPAITTEFIERPAVANLRRIERAFVSELAGTLDGQGRAGGSRTLRCSQKSSPPASSSTRARLRAPGHEGALNAVTGAFVATETFNRRNQGALVAESLETARCSWGECNGTLGPRGW